MIVRKSSNGWKWPKSKHSEPRKGWNHIGRQAGEGSQSIRIIDAIYVSKCPRCLDVIRIGDKISNKDGKWVHSAPACKHKEIDSTDSTKMCDTPQSDIRSRSANS